MVPSNYSDSQQGWCFPNTDYCWVSWTGWPFLSLSWPLGLPCWLNGKGSACHCRDPWGFSLWVRKIPWRRKCQPTPVFLPGESHGRRTLAGYSPWGHEEADTTERLSKNGSLPVRQGPVCSLQVCPWLKSYLLLTGVAPGAWNLSVKSFSPTCCQLLISISTVVEV